MIFVLFIDRLLAGGITFVLDKVARAVEAEQASAGDGERLKEELLEAQLRLELGEIDEAEYAAIEQGILAQLAPPPQAVRVAKAGRPGRSARRRR